MKNLLILILYLLAGYSNISSGQNKNKKIIITGTVKDAQQKPIEGATIFINKIKTTSVTDQNGFYKVKTNSDAGTIMVFTFFNGVSEVEIKGRTTIDFILTGKPSETKEKAKTEDDEVVNIGYGTARKKDLSNATGVIDGQDPKFVAYQTIYDMIRGRLPGVEVSGKSIKIMGSSSLNVSTEPLFVLDGVIVNTIEDIAPQTVKSIEVLKGPAASVYGTRGSNGVILITTLSGKDIK
jgi:TonB-dependent SusC/RagA subfamily outer membrane receptor